MADTLTGRVVIVTGAAHGMGEAIARTFASQGAAIGLLDLDSEGLEAVLKTIRSSGGIAFAQTVDVRSYEQIVRAVEAVESVNGPTDILVNSAGLGIYKAFEELTEEDWDTTFDVNMKGTFLMCKAVIPGMVQRGSGLVMNIASLAALILGFDRGSCYSASKYAVRGFSSYLYRELKRKGVRVSCLCPGSTDSHFRGQPTGNPNYMIPQDVADAALYVATQRPRVSVAEVAFSTVNEGW